MRLLLLLWVSGIYLSVVHGASLTVIYDSGDTLSITPYYKDNNIVRLEPDKHKIKSLPKKNSQIPYQIHFPIVSKSVSPGVVAKQAINLPHMQTPVFILGTDSQSKQWASTHYPELMKLKAIGLITNINSAAELKSITDLVPELTLIPVVVDDIAKQLNIKHYPILISKSLIEQ